MGIRRLNFFDSPKSTVTYAGSGYWHTNKATGERRRISHQQAVIIANDEINEEIASPHNDCKTPD